MRGLDSLLGLVPTKALIWFDAVAVLALMVWAEWQVSGGDVPSMLVSLLTSLVAAVGGYVACQTVEDANAGE